jgi:uncharacterized protein
VGCRIGLHRRDGSAFFRTASFSEHAAMSISLYSATVPVYLQILQSVAGLLDKAESHCRAHGLPDTELTGARLTEDMWPLANQIRSCWQHSVDAMDGVRKGEFCLDLSDPPADFAGLKARIADAIERLGAVRPEEVDALVGKDLCFKSSRHELDFIVEDYLMTFALPSFYFHVSMAYAILRVKGVAIGKGDYLGAVRMKR